MGSAMSVLEQKQSNINKQPDQHFNQHKQRLSISGRENIHDNLEASAEKEHFAMNTRSSLTAEEDTPKRHLRSSARLRNVPDASPALPTRSSKVATVDTQDRIKGGDVDLAQHVNNETELVSEIDVRSDWVTTLDTAHSQMMEYIYNPVGGAAGIEQRKDECRRRLLATFTAEMGSLPAPAIKKHYQSTIDHLIADEAEESPSTRSTSAEEIVAVLETTPAAKTKAKAKPQIMAETESLSDTDSTSEAESASETETNPKRNAVVRKKKSSRNSTGKSKPSGWSTEEDDACIELMKAVSADDRFYGLEIRFAEISRRMAAEYRFTRSAPGIKTQWNRRLRKLSGFEDRSDRRQSDRLVTSSLASKGSVRTSVGRTSVGRSSAGRSSVGEDGNEPEEHVSPPMETRALKKRARLSSPPQARKKKTPSERAVDLASAAPPPALIMPPVKLHLRRPVSGKVSPPEEPTKEPPDEIKAEPLPPSEPRRRLWRSVTNTADASDILLMAADDDTDSEENEDETSSQPADGATNKATSASDRNDTVPETKHTTNVSFTTANTKTGPNSTTTLPVQRRKSAAGIAKPHWTTEENNACVAIMKELIRDPAFGSATARYEECSRRLAGDPYNVYRNAKAVFSRWNRYLGKASGVEER